METPEPGPADGEERLVELRPRTRSNPEGAEDRRNSTGSLGGNSNPNITQPAVGSRVEGEGEASTSDSPPTSTTLTVSTAAAQTVAPAAVATVAAAGATVLLSTAAVAAKERSKPTQQQSTLTTTVPTPPEYQLRVPRVNCPEKVVGLHHSFEINSIPSIWIHFNCCFVHQNRLSAWTFQKRCLCRSWSHLMGTLKLINTVFFCICQHWLIWLFFHLGLKQML